MLHKLKMFLIEASSPEDIFDNAIEAEEEIKAKELEDIIDDSDLEQKEEKEITSRLINSAEKFGKLKYEDQLNVSSYDSRLNEGQEAVVNFVNDLYNNDLISLKNYNHDKRKKHLSKYTSLLAFQAYKEGDISKDEITKLLYDANLPAIFNLASKAYFYFIKSNLDMPYKNLMNESEVVFDHCLKSFNPNFKEEFKIKQFLKVPLKMGRIKSVIKPTPVSPAVQKEIDTKKEKLKQFENIEASFFTYFYAALMYRYIRIFNETFASKTSLNKKDLKKALKVVKAYNKLTSDEKSSLENIVQNISSSTKVPREDVEKYITNNYFITSMNQQFSDDEGKSTEYGDTIASETLDASEELMKKERIEAKAKILKDILQKLSPKERIIYERLIINKDLRSPMYKKDTITSVAKELNVSRQSIQTIVNDINKMIIHAKEKEKEKEKQTSELEQKKKVVLTKTQQEYDALFQKYNINDLLVFKIGEREFKAYVKEHRNNKKFLLFGNVILKDLNLTSLSLLPWVKNKWSWMIGKDKKFDLTGNNLQNLYGMPFAIVNWELVTIDENELFSIDDIKEAVDKEADLFF